jgi:triacylglycerol lipase
MSELLNFVPWVLLFGIVLIGLSRLGRFDEDQRHRMWTVGIIAIAASVVGLLYLFQAPPGREITIEEDRDNIPTPKPNPSTLLRDQLDAPWTTESRSDWAVSQLMVNLCQIGYQDPIDARDQFKRLGFENSETIVAASMIGYVMSIGEVGVVVLRGSDDSADWIRNFTFLPSSLPEGQVHGGIYGSYLPLSDQVKRLLDRFKVKRVWLTGHSLGGALSVLSAYDLGGESRFAIQGLMTFGQPMVVNKPMGSFLTKRLSTRYVHFVNGADIVPRTTPPYSHFGTLVWFVDGKIRRSKYATAMFSSDGKNDPFEEPNLEPVSNAEFNQLKQQLEIQSKVVGAISPGDEPKTMALYDSISDHRMANYKNMIDFLTGRPDVEVSFVREGN